MEDGVELSSGYSRHVVMPDADLSAESAEVQAICSVVHTDEVVAAYQASLPVEEEAEEVAEEGGE